MPQQIKRGRVKRKQGRGATSPAGLPRIIRDTGRDRGGYACEYDIFDVLYS